MAARSRVGALVLAAVALALTVTGVVIAATNSPNGGSLVDPFALHGYPPKSADLALTLSTGRGVTLTANVNVNFVAGQVDAVVHFPLIITTVAVELREVASTLYLRSADASSGPWLATPEKLPSLFGLSLEFVQPSADLALVSGYHERVTTNANQTTYTLSRSNVAVSSIIATKSSNVMSGTTVLGTVTFSVTVGKGGEFQSGYLHVTSGTTTTTLHVSVLSYNASPRVAAPRASDVHPLHRATFNELFKNRTLRSVLLPLGLFSSGSTSLS